MRLLGILSLQILLGLWVGAVLIVTADLKADYQKYQEKLKQQTNPVGKTKVLIKMSEIDLKEALAQVQSGNLDEADKFLIRYTGVIRQATQILKDSNRNAQKNPAGFRDFEISLHLQLRRLNDLKEYYAYDQQKIVEKAAEVAQKAQQDMLLAIFGPENLRKPEEKKGDRTKGPK